MPEDPRNKSEGKQFKRKVFALIISACIIICFYFCVLRYAQFTLAVHNIFKVFQPIVIGLVMAFLMDPIMKFFERKLIKPFSKVYKSQEKAFVTTRTISTILALLIMIGIAALFIWAVVPEMIDTITYLVYHIEEQIAAVLDWCNDITGGRYEEALMNVKNSEMEDALSSTVDYLKQYLDYDDDQLVSLVTSSVIGTLKVLINIIIGMFVSVYVLVSKETFKGQCKKIVCGLCKPEHANIVLEVSRKSGEIFYGFITGKILDSFIIGCICYIGCLIMGMPYVVLVSVIIGVTNIIPVFGPYIGAVPTVIVIFLTEPMQGIYFLIFVLVLQQIDGNLIGPKILGNSMGISSFWVVFPVVVGGGLFGVPGMIIGVPVVAIVYYLVGRHARYMVKKRNLPEETTPYEKMDHIDVETNELIMSQEETKKKKDWKKFFKTKKK